MYTNDCIAIKNDDEIEFLDANESLNLIKEFNQQISVCLENGKIVYIKDANLEEGIYNVSIPDAMQTSNSVKISQTEYTYDESISNSKSNTLGDGFTIDLLEEYVCEFCFKSFAQHHHLKSHLSVHTDVYKKTLKKRQKSNVCNTKCKVSKLKKQKASGSSVRKKTHTRLARAIISDTKQITENEKIALNEDSEENIALSAKLRNKDNPLKEINELTNYSQQKQSLMVNNTKKNYTKGNITQMEDRCAICNKIFSNQQGLINHAQEIHSKAKALKCQECNECFSNTSSLSRHFKFHKEIPKQSVRKTRSSKRKEVQIESQQLNKNNETNDDSLRMMSLAENSSNNKTQRMQTKDCDKSLESKIPVETIVGEHLNLTSTHSDSEKIDKPLKRKRRTVGKRKCKFCLKILPNETTFNRHIIKHTEERPYSCSICNFAFKRLDSLKAHKRVHLDPKLLKKRKKYKCDFCSKSLFKANLKEHLMIHTGERPFSCTQCKESFKRKADLKKHQQRHLNPKSQTNLDLKILDNKCAVCSKIVYNKQDLIKHAKEVHTSDCRPFKCRSCPSQFLIMRNLRRHYKIFHPDESEKHLHSCSICQQTLPNSYKLKVHERSHGYKTRISHIATDNNCAICKESFKFHVDLTEHVKKCHPKGTPFKCRDCSRTFCLVSSVVYHYKNAHKDKLNKLDTEGITKSECHDNTNKNKDLVQNSKGQLASNIGKKARMKTSFDQHKNLKRHLKTHAANNQFFCSLCEKSFKNENNLKLHLENHIRNAKQKNI